MDKLKEGQSKDQKEVAKKRLPEVEWLAKQTCHRCKQKGHLKKNCPKLAGQANSAMMEVADASSTSSATSTQRCQAWKYKKESSDGMTKVVNGKTYYWCTKCTTPMWALNHGDAHPTQKHVKNWRPGTVANLGVISEDEIPTPPVSLVT